MSTARERLAGNMQSIGYVWSQQHADDVSELLAERDAKCMWTYDDCQGHFTSSCNWQFSYLWSASAVKKFKHCPNCGKEIVSE